MTRVKNQASDALIIDALLNLEGKTMKSRYAMIAAAALWLAGSSSAQMMGGVGMGSMGSQPGSGLARNTMMAGIPGYGMGFGPYAPGMVESLGLTLEQRAAIDAIHEDLWRNEWDVMGDMQVLMWNAPGSRGRGAGYDEMIVLRREMLAALDEARTRIDAVLTPEQRDRLRQLSSCRP